MQGNNEKSAGTVQTTKQVKNTFMRRSDGRVKGYTMRVDGQDGGKRRTEDCLPLFFLFFLPRNPGDASRNQKRREVTGECCLKI